MCTGNLQIILALSISSFICSRAKVELIEEEKLKPGQRRISNKTPGTGGQFVQSYQEALDENGDFVKCIINHSEDGIDNTDK